MNWPGGALKRFKPSKTGLAERSILLAGNYARRFAPKFGSHPKEGFIGRFL